MKSFPCLRIVVASAAALLLLASCKSPESTAGAEGSSRNETVRPINPSLPLIDALRNLPGVQISGGGNNYQIQVRGASSFRLENDNNNPLFVIDGIPMGTNYNDAANSVSMSEVTAIRLVRGSELTRRFGSRAGAGVIEILTN